MKTELAFDSGKPGRFLSYMGLNDFYNYRVVIFKLILFSFQNSRFFGAWRHKS
jgi:hypothetical protein